MKLILTTAAASAVLALPTAAFAAPGGPPATINGSATAEVIAPLQLTCGPMHWGQLAPLHTATTVTMNAQGIPLDDPDNIVVPGSRTNAQAGHCDATGEIGMTFHVTLPTSETLSNGSATMTMTDFTVSADLDGTPTDPLNRTLENLGGNGFNGFGVGAKLHVGADQPVGLYTGTYTVSVQYN
jgi:hypothetical protein